MLKWVSSVYNSTPVDVRTLNFWYVICYTISLKMARFGNSKRLSVKSSFLEPKCGQKSQIWPPCDQIALANWIIYMNLHFKWRKIFTCGGDRPTILSVSQLLSVNQNDSIIVLCYLLVPTGQFFVVRMLHEASRLIHLSPQFITKEIGKF